jgi:YgiT-type zinc finger domain-containing protein
MFAGHVIDSEYDEAKGKEIAILIETWDCDHCGEVFYEDDVCYPDPEESAT